MGAKRKDVHMPGLNVIEKLNTRHIPLQEKKFNSVVQIYVVALFHTQHLQSVHRGAWIPHTQIYKSQLTIDNS